VPLDAIPRAERESRIRSRALRCQEWWSPLVARAAIRAADQTL